MKMVVMEEDVGFGAGRLAQKNRTLFWTKHYPVPSDGLNPFASSASLAIRQNSSADSRT